jgi:hypothetical protein
MAASMSQAAPMNRRGCEERIAMKNVTNPFRRRKRVAFAIRLSALKSVLKGRSFNAFKAGAS